MLDTCLFLFHLSQDSSSTFSHYISDLWLNAYVPFLWWSTHLFVSSRSLCILFTFILSSHSQEKQWVDLYAGVHFISSHMVNISFLFHHIINIFHTFLIQNWILLYSELLIVGAVQWHMIRAAQMLVAMRAISIGFQLDGNVLQSLPEPLPYFGYLFYVGTISFGPWIPFKDYINIGASNQSVKVISIISTS